MLRNDVYSDSHKVFHVRKDGKDDLIDIDGNFVIPMIYDNLSREVIAKTDTFLVAKLGDKYGALDYSGNVLLPFEYDSMEVAGEKIVSVIKDKKFAVIDIDGNIIAPYGDKGYGPVGEGFYTSWITFYKQWWKICGFSIDLPGKNNQEFIAHFKRVR